MENLLLQSLCSALLSLGLLFLFFDVKARYDYHFRFIGALILLVGMMTAVDAWIEPPLFSSEAELAGDRFAHLLACLMAPLTMQYLLHLTHRRNPVLVTAFVAASAAVGVLLYSTPMLRLEGALIRGGAWYWGLYIPYGLVYIVASHYLILSGMSRVAAPERRALRLHLLGFFCLSVFGFLDLLCFVFPALQVMDSFKAIGNALFGITGAAVLIDRFIMLLRERDGALDRLKATLQEMEKSRAMRDLGESAVHINHEIKNLLSIMRGNLTLVKRHSLPPAIQEGFARVERSTDQMERLSRGILGLAITSRREEWSSLRIDRLVQKCIDSHLPKHASRIGLETATSILPEVLGDAHSLDRVFLNLFLNALEAGATHIQVRITAFGGLLAAAIEDDGHGFEPDAVEDIFTMFYTTKKGAGGTGLGAYLSRSIVESHGGTLVAHAKNGAGAGQNRGLIMNLLLPVTGTPDSGPGANVFAHRPVSQAWEARMLRILGNVGQAPRFHPAGAQPAPGRPGILFLEIWSEEYAAGLTGFEAVYGVDECGTVTPVKPFPGTAGSRWFTEEFVLRLMNLAAAAQPSRDRAGRNPGRPARAEP